MSNMMDSSFMTTPSVASANPLDIMMDSLRAQIVGEVKSDITGDIIDRVIRIVGSALQNLQLNQAITVNPIVEKIALTTPAPIVDIELNVDDLVAELKATRDCMEKCLMMMAAPMQRIVQRDSAGLILSITERRM